MFYTPGRNKSKPVKRKILVRTDCNTSLFETLRVLRMSLARKNRMPPYVIFSDRTLKEMAAQRPATNIDMLGVSGVGARKLAQFGDAFLKAIADFNG